MHRTGRLLTVAGSALSALGLLVVLLAIIAPDAAPQITVTYDLRHLRTPTPAYLGTPLAPPGGRPAAEAIDLVLPVMPVGGPVTRTPTAVPSPSPTAPPTRTPAATSTPAPSLSPSPTPTTAASDTPTPTAPIRRTPRPPVPQRIVIPAIDVDAPVQPVGWHTIEIDGQTFGQWDVPDGYAAGWHNTSAPLGQPGNTVLNGHHNIEGEVFGKLIDLEPGDTIYLQGGGRTRRYTVAQIMTLQERWRTPEERLENARWIQPGDDERLTLVTCWPRTGNSHRLIVVALPAEDEPHQPFCEGGC